MLTSPFKENQYLDFHTHRIRCEDEAGVMEIVSLHLGKPVSHEFFTIGLHPWWTEQIVSPEQSLELQKMLSDPYCLAMGEMGLDNLKGPEIHVQIDILRSQLAIADKMGLSVIIHCVRAFDQLVKIKNEFPKISNWCVHGYGRHATLAKQLIREGFFLSIMPGLPSAKLKELLKAIPIDRLFLETDSMPEVNIRDVYSQAAEVMEIDVSALCKQMNENAKAFFNR